MASAPNSIIRPPTSWTVGSWKVNPYSPDDEDPRGVLWVWEEPSPRETYVVSLDPTVGRAQWSREFRTEADQDTDNAAIEVFRAGRGGRPDAQVAEFVAPIDAVDIAPITATIGHVYAGGAEDGQALLIGEMTGPGAITQRELFDKYEYHNLWQWTKWGTSTPQRTSQFWWYSSRAANKDLWIRGSHHIHNKRADIRSPWLVEEMADCVADIWLLIGEARYGRHDDRVMATLFNLWALHDWSVREEIEPMPRAEESNTPYWQRTAISAEEMQAEWEARYEALLDSE